MTQGSQIQIENRFEAAIAPYDELSIIVSTSSSKKELATPFNLGNSTNTSSNNSRYLVDVNGDIQMPIIGNLHVAGLTRLRLQDTLAAMLKNGGYIDEPFVMVRFNNFKVFFLGGGKGKVLNIANERCTFLEALAMLGSDFDLHTRRDHIAVMREINGRMVMRYLDPRSSDVFNDPFFMLQQNDFIIADTYNNGIVRSEFTYWVGIASLLASISSLILSIAVLKKS
jgi:polysaccharide export outer membrane protein